MPTYIMTLGEFIVRMRALLQALIYWYGAMISASSAWSEDPRKVWTI